MTFKRYIRSFISIQGAFLAIGVVLPIAASLDVVEPPLLEPSGIAVGAVAAAVILIAYFYTPRHKATTGRIPPLVRTAVKAFIAAAVVCLGYLFLLNYTTVIGPSSRSGEEIRYQIGFGRWAWSLTDEGKEVRTASPKESLYTWMWNDALFYDHGPEVLWRRWSIYSAGVLLVMLFLLPFVLWTFGWSLLVKQHALL